MLIAVEALLYSQADDSISSNTWIVIVDVTVVTLIITTILVIVTGTVNINSRSNICAIVVGALVMTGKL